MGIYLRIDVHCINLYNDLLTLAQINMATITNFPSDLLNTINSYCVAKPLGQAEPEKVLLESALSSGQYYIGATLHPKIGTGHSLSKVDHIEDSAQLRELIKAAELRKHISYPKNVTLAKTCRRFREVFGEDLEGKRKNYVMIVGSAVSELLKTPKGHDAIVKCIEYGVYLDSLYLYFVLNPKDLQLLFPRIIETFWGAAPLKFIVKLINVGEKHGLNLQITAHQHARNHRLKEFLAEKYPSSAPQQAGDYFIIGGGTTSAVNRWGYRWD